MINGKDRKYGRVSLSRKTSARINPRWLILLAGNKPSDRGFTMLEVLIAIMVITFFLAGTLQLMAIDTLYKILAKQQANANQWIQEDVEEIRAIAASLTPNSTNCNATATSNYALALYTAIASNTNLPGANPKPLLGSTGKLYELRRRYPNPLDTTPAFDSSQPHVLKISYEVIDTAALAGTNQDINRTANATIAKFYTEVIPAASFQCPPPTP